MTARRSTAVPAIKITSADTGHAAGEQGEPLRSRAGLPSLPLPPPRIDRDFLHLNTHHEDALTRRARRTDVADEWVTDDSARHAMTADE